MWHTLNKLSQLVTLNIITQTWINLSSDVRELTFGMFILICTYLWTVFMWYSAVWLMGSNIWKKPATCTNGYMVSNISKATATSVDGYMGTNNSKEPATSTHIGKWVPTCHKDLLPPQMGTWVPTVQRNLLPLPSMEVFICSIYNGNQLLKFYCIKWLNGRKWTRQDLEGSVQGQI